MRCAHTFAAVALSIITAVPLLAQDDPPRWPERELEFERSDEAIRHPEEFATARYAASFMVTGVSASDQRTMHNRVDNWLLQTPLSEQLSGEQRELLRGADVVSQVGPEPRFRRSISTDARFEIRAYAVSEEDARLMARAVIQWLERDRRHQFEASREWLAASIEGLATKRQDLEAFLREHPAPGEALETVQKTVWYESVDEAQEDVRVLEKAMRAVDVDIAGITAKTTSIEGYLSNGAAADRPGVADMLNQLLIQQDIEMAGAVARKAALESHLQRARDYLRAVEVNEACKRLTVQIRSTEDYIERQRKELETPEWSYAPLEVLSPVTIQPLEHSDG